MGRRLALVVRVLAVGAVVIIATISSRQVYLRIGDEHGGGYRGRQRRSYRQDADILQVQA